MGKASVETPEPAPFNKIDIQQTGIDATNADIASFGYSDADFARRFPGLARGKQVSIDNAYKELTGPLDPTVQNSFVTSGLEKAFSSFGGGSPGGSVTGIGSIGRKTVASDVANSLESKQDYDRGVFDNLLTSNLPRSFGLSGSDAANLSIANTGNLNQINQSNYAGAISSQNARNAADASNKQAAVGTAVAVAGIIAVLI